MIIYGEVRKKNNIKAYIQFSNNVNEITSSEFNGYHRKPILVIIDKIIKPILFSLSVNAIYIFMVDFIMFTDSEQELEFTFHLLHS